jgi:hypothetical protein
MMMKQKHPSRGCGFRADADHLNSRPAPKDTAPTNSLPKTDNYAATPKRQRTYIILFREIYTQVGLFAAFQGESME